MILLLAASVRFMGVHKTVWYRCFSGQKWAIHMPTEVLIPQFHVASCDILRLALSGLKASWLVSVSTESTNPKKLFIQFKECQYG